MNDLISVLASLPASFEEHLARIVFEHGRAKRRLNLYFLAIAISFSPLHLSVFPLSSTN